MCVYVFMPVLHWCMVGEGPLEDAPPMISDILTSLGASVFLLESLLWERRIC